MTAPQIFLRSQIFGPIVVCILLGAVSCKPAATPVAEHVTPQNNQENLRQPDAKEFATFLKSLLPPAIQLADVQSDPPARMPNTSPADNAWIISTKLTFKIEEDIFNPPTSEDSRMVNSLVDELNGLIEWRNAFVRSPYAKIYPAFEVATPVSPAPQIITAQHRKGETLLPIYGKVAAEWQVDHWNFENIDIQLPSLGGLRGSFTGSTVVKGSPEAEKFLTAEREAIAQARKKKEAIESSYQADLVRATQPGTIYKGQITHRLGALACEVKFMSPNGPEPQMTIFSVRLLQEPTYEIVYSARLSAKMPIRLYRM